jgi:hypothetical protein
MFQPPSQYTQPAQYGQPSPYGQSDDPEPGALPPYGPSAQQPQYGQPQYGQPQYGQPQYGQPQYGQPQYGQPQYGQPQYGQPPEGQPAYGSPPRGASPYQPQSYGNPSPPPQYGQPQYGQPQYGQPPGSPQYGPPPGMYQTSPTPPRQVNKKAIGILAALVAVVVVIGGIAYAVTKLSSHKLSHSAVEKTIETQSTDTSKSFRTITAVNCNDGKDITVKKDASFTCTAAGGVRITVVIKSASSNPDWVWAID